MCVSQLCGLFCCGFVLKLNIALILVSLPACLSTPFGWVLWLLQSCIMWLQFVLNYITVLMLFDGAGWLRKERKLRLLQYLNFIKFLRENSISRFLLWLKDIFDPTFPGKCYHRLFHIRIPLQPVQESKLVNKLGKAKIIQIV